jgi:hypothetical protein
MAIKPEDVLPDDVNSTIVNGVNVRKGSVAAVLANLKLLDSLDIKEDEKEAALGAIKSLAPALVAVGFKKYLTFNNPDIQKIVDEVAEEMEN